MSLTLPAGDRSRGPRAPRIAELAVTGAAIVLATVGLAGVTAAAPPHIPGEGALVVVLP